MSLLSYYQKFENTNPYFISFGNLNNSEYFDDHVRLFADHILKIQSGIDLISSNVADQNQPGVFGKMASYLTFWSTPQSQSSSSSNGMIPFMSGSLLSIYDLVHCNSSYRKSICSPLSNNNNANANNNNNNELLINELLQNLLQFCSSIVSDIHTLYTACYCKMCFTIFLILTEDKNSASLLHDPEIGTLIPSLFEKVKNFTSKKREKKL